MAPGQLEALTGIVERRWWEPGYPLSDGAAAAARKALAAADVTADDIDVLIYAGVCREQFEPATACRVAAELGISPDAAFYDLSNACLGVLNGIVDIANRIELGQIRAGLVVSCETAREINDIVIDRMLRTKTMELFSESLATLTGGSGAVAVLVTDEELSREKRRRLLGGVTQTAPQYHGLCRWGLQVAPPARRSTRSRRSSATRPARWSRRASTSACGTSWSRSWRRTPARCSSTASSSACGPGRRSCASSAGRPTSRQGDLPPGRRRAPRRDPQGARHPAGEGLLHLRVPGQHRHRLAAADRGPGRGARVPPARRPRRLPRHRQRPELPDARRWNGEPALPVRRSLPLAAAAGNSHYLDEGSGEPVVMVHGNPTWSFYYRNLVLALRDRYRCIVPDHIGCGLSDKPRESRYDYTLKSPRRRPRSAARPPRACARTSRSSCTTGAA